MRGARCNKWALKGSEFCSTHGGRLYHKHPVRTYHLPRFYSKHLHRTLSEVIEEALAASPREQLNLSEELAVMRATAADVCKLYDACTSFTTRVKAGDILRSVMKEVVSVCESAARVEALAKDKLNVHNLAYVISQVVRCAYDVFSDDLPKAKEFETLIRETIRVPNEAQGTTVTPDQDAMDMDGTIPRNEDDQ